MKKGLCNEALAQPKFSNDPNEYFICSVDACDVSVGGILLQYIYNQITKQYEEKVIGYYSKTLNKNQRGWAVELGQYNMTMQHISGAKHTQADIVSRLGYLLTTNSKKVK
eukprot:Pgem_evm1s16799